MKHHISRLQHPRDGRGRLVTSEAYIAALDDFAEANELTRGHNPQEDRDWHTRPDLDEALQYWLERI